MVQRRPRAPHPHTPPDRLLVAPELRLALCWTPKVGSRFLVHLFQSLTGCRQHPLAEGNTACGHAAPGWLGPLAPPGCNASSGLHRCNGVWKREAWHGFRRLVVLRDPLSRFLSAYEDKFGAVTNRTYDPALGVKAWDNPNVLKGGQTWRQLLRTSGAVPSADLLAANLKTRGPTEAAIEDCFRAPGGPPHLSPCAQAVGEFDMHLQQQVTLCPMPVKNVRQSTFYQRFLRLDT